MGHAKVYLCTKLEVSSFTNFKIMEGSQNSEIRPMDPTTPPLEIFVIRKMRLAKLYPRKGYQILNF